MLKDSVDNINGLLRPVNYCFEYELVVRKVFPTVQLSAISPGMRFKVLEC